MPTTLNLTNGWTISIAEDDINEDGNCWSVCAWRTCDKLVPFTEREFWYRNIKALRVFSSAELIEELEFIGKDNP